MFPHDSAANLLQFVKYVREKIYQGTHKWLMLS
jgi:hypothetical protein